MIQMTNRPNCWGFIAKTLHLLSAIVICALFAIGLTMVGLDYYDPLYQTMPAVHKSIGVSLIALSVVRVAWRWVTPAPIPIDHVSRVQARLAAATHLLLYLLIFATGVAGYLISTADGRPLNWFDGVAIPALIHGYDGQEEIAGTVHLILASTLIGLASLHALAALKHHFIDRDDTLRRMFWRGTQ